jgi:hypothetical protein
VPVLGQLVRVAPGGALEDQPKSSSARVAATIAVDEYSFDLLQTPEDLLGAGLLAQLPEAGRRLVLAD